MIPDKIDLDRGPYGRVVGAGFCTECGTAYIQFEGYGNLWYAGNCETECGEIVGGDADGRCHQAVTATTFGTKFTVRRGCYGDIWSEEKLDSGYDPLKTEMNY